MEFLNFLLKMYIFNGLFTLFVFYTKLVVNGKERESLSFKDFIIASFFVSFVWPLMMFIHLQDMFESQLTTVRLKKHVKNKILFATKMESELS